MTTLFRDTFHDGTLPTEKVAELQIEDMAYDANLAGKALANVTLIFDGTVAEARTDPVASQYIQDHVADTVDGMPNHPMRLLVHSADVVDPEEAS
ncbi:hypothetical protein FZI85_17310 [Mycobacterium sp. CBMA293]|uniref:hypothetical protein n=1 Tax=unclassified Mycolicibacterium TaxID=2636767 RepID=UPI0012DE1EFD|nr:MULTISPECIES: hypothetical protein [unclassified Mycolicibacterium]MUL44481.1 hypothetical protein [Mycolicibacterium sp. CBMA 360]MUL59801.1 hypothetical protein [Mycolicibacterium sp. CBMA 335]MUL68644.1 hypothetical protein [Mycolicibacterium sp. CBMA 311]MUL93965.1 hypothetical protein [Mycolicibacterium sp. CBMA 230]MUM06210.1 hypothetical protein [Mycolicibacterium sp. CBMA 213]